MANTWNRAGTTWGQGLWGEQDSMLASPSGVAATTSVGSVSGFSNQGWSRATWGNEPWGENYNPSINITGLGMTASVGSVSAFNAEGWGHDTWGDASWGIDTVYASLTGLEMEALSGPNTWGENAYGHGAWQSFAINYALGVDVTGVSATASLGTVTETRSSTQTPTGVSSTVSLGSLSINNGADHTQGLGGLAATASVGSFGFAWICFPDGVEATMSTGEITVASIELIDVTGVSATASVGSITPAAMSIGLTGVSSTASVGSISPTAMTMGLTGVSATASVADLTTASGGGIIAFADIDTGTNISYSSVATGSNVTYSDVDTP